MYRPALQCTNVEPVTTASLAEGQSFGVTVSFLPAQVPLSTRARQHGCRWPASLLSATAPSSRQDRMLCLSWSGKLPATPPNPLCSSASSCPAVLSKLSGTKTRRWLRSRSTPPTSIRWGPNRHSQKKVHCQCNTMSVIVVTSYCQIWNKFLFPSSFQFMKMRMKTTTGTCWWWRELQRGSWTAALPSWFRVKSSPWMMRWGKPSKTLTWSWEGWEREFWVRMAGLFQEFFFPAA